MAKTSKKKRAGKKRTGSAGTKTTRTRYEVKVDKALTDNFIALQKVMVNLSAKFDVLASQISKLLELFEISAKSLVSKDIEAGKEDKDSKKILDKLDNISQQAGLIGRGLALVHQINTERGGAVPVEITPHPAPQMPRPRMPPRNPRPSSEFQGYQKSISSTPSDKKPEPGSENA